RATVNGLPA
nr:RecName: Full=Unknown protein 19 [Pseudotsuga menziesii]